MKKIILRSLLIVSAFLAAEAKAQDIYWREGFDGTNTISGTNPLTSGGPNNYYAQADQSQGDWYFHNTYRTTGTPCPTYGSQHLRMLQNTTDTPYFVLPIVDFGVNEVHFTRSANSGTAGARTRRVSVFVRADTIANLSPYAATGWVRIGFAPASDNFCVDTFITIPPPYNTTTRRVAIGSSQAANTDIDSIYLVSAMPITTPVKFNGISASFLNGNVKVLWSNETEVNTLRYEIERSADGRNFTQVGSVNATNIRSYSFMDNSPLTGTNFYRIKGVDRDGKLTLSSVVRVNTAKGIQQVVVSPNPVENHVLNLQLANFAPGNYTLSLYNAGGQVVFSKTMRNEGSSSSESVLLPSIVSPGVYTLQLSNGIIREKKMISIK